MLGWTSVEKYQCHRIILPSSFFPKLPKLVISLFPTVTLRFTTSSLVYEYQLTYKLGSHSRIWVPIHYPIPLQPHLFLIVSVLPSFLSEACVFKLWASSGVMASTEFQSQIDLFQTKWSKTLYSKSIPIEQDTKDMNKEKENKQRQVTK